MPTTVLSRFALSRVVLTTALIASTSACAAPLPDALPEGSPNAPVETLDLDRYDGTWHEVARLPMFFQRHCIADTTATYAQRDDGRITVTNACRTDDGRIESVGVARTTDAPGALEVRFAPDWLGWVPMVWADYWVVDLDPGYAWAVVGGPKQGAMWILSRKPTLDPALFARLQQRAEARGYDLGDIVVDPAQLARNAAE